MTISPPAPEIIAREQAYWHGFGRSVTVEARPLSGVDKLLMSDESITYGCQHCEYMNENMKSVQTHLTKHSTKGWGVHRHTPETITKILHWEELERAVSRRGWPERVAQRLNKAKIPTLSGDKWYAHEVQSLAKRYKDGPPQIGSTPSETAGNPLDLAPAPHDGVNEAAFLNAETWTTPAVHAQIFPNSHAETVQQLIACTGDLERARMAVSAALNKVNRLLPEVVAILETPTVQPIPDDYEEIKVKAQKWDQMRSLIGPGE